MILSNFKSHSAKLLMTATSFIVFTTDAMSLGAVAPFQGAKQAGRAGVGAATPDDATSGNINPALMANVGNVISIDLGALYNDHTMDYAVVSTPAINGLGVPFVNYRSAGPQRNRDTITPLAFGGYNYEINEKWTFGQTFTAVYSFVAYDNNFLASTNRVPPIILNGFGGGVVPASPQFGYGNNYIKGITPQLNNIFSWKPDDRQAYAVSLILSYKMLETNLFANNRPLPHARARNYAFGAGFKIGGHWKLTPTLDLGLALGTPIWARKFKDYSTLFKYPLVEPWNGIVGLSWKASSNITVGFDIEASMTGLQRFFGADPLNGFGWRNAFNYKTSIDYQFYPNLTGRFGYNYGATPINRDFVFANPFFQGVTVSKHMIGAGLTYKAAKKFDLDFAVNYFFKNSIKDNGRRFPSTTATSAGARLTAQSLSVLFGFNYKYGEKS